MSAENTARSTLAAVHGDGVRALQHVLYRAAKADPDRRFHALRTRSTARTSCGGRGSRCAGTTARRASTRTPWLMSRSPG